ncbi:hypothetical protein N0Y54_36695 [Nostoc punctiforme UO1]|uniref:hypothetical protein n=1 Tax=Nostoc punctiforme TaxID=272131 RepID=UPI00309F0FE4
MLFITPIAHISKTSQIREKIDWGDNWWTAPHKSDVYNGLRLRYFLYHQQPYPVTRQAICSKLRSLLAFF